ncbi:ABC transporter permease [Thermosipho affectus]|uniref:ABC transporter permease n=1 Tax=Thermosipho affectus TaxID=660294 RepID=A0ABX3IGG5_9BACT|nr:ABC transporter permease subunit [Thermosipho affectus]ONN26927.1 ABC transporter permease [Thermosipho affectus]
MKKEWIDMKTRSILTFVVMLILFFSIAPFQNFVIDLLNKNSEVIQRFVGNNFVEKLKNWDFYILSQWFGKNFGQIIPIIGIILSFPLFSREFENETISFLLVRKSRKNIFYNKFIVSFIVLSIEIFVLSYIPYIYSIITNKTLSFETTTKFFIHSFIGAFFWYSISFMFSVIFNDQVKPLLTSFAILGISTTLGFLRPISFLNTYKYVLGYKIFKESTIDFTYSTSLILIGTILLSFSYYLFENKEV